MYGEFLYKYKYGERASDYYCGVTNDVIKNLARHNIDCYFSASRCDTAEIAAEVEERLGEMGFDIGGVEHGGNGAAEDSVYVYMYRKTSTTIQ